MADTELIQAYRELLKELLPKGWAWDQVRQDDSLLLQALAIELCRIDGRVQDMLREFDVRNAVELLPEWEALLGLPDECTPEGADIFERQDQAAQKYAALGGMSEAYFEGIADDLGFDAEVSNIPAFRVGTSRVGDALTNPRDADRDVFRVGRNRVGDRLRREGWTFFFEVNIPADDVEAFRVGINRVGEPLREFSNDLLECTIKKLKPAHTGVYFTFRDVP